MQVMSQLKKQKQKKQLFDILLDNGQKKLTMTQEKYLTSYFVMISSIYFPCQNCGKNAKLQILLIGMNV